MEKFLGFAIPGIPFGCTIAIFAVGLVLGYQATGVFNFGYGAQAYVSAFIYAWLIDVQHFPVVAAFVIAVPVIGPLLGLCLDRFLFRHIAASNTTAKVVTGLSLLVGIPTLLPVLFGTQNLINTPSIGFSTTFSFHLFGIQAFPITGFDCSAMICTVVMLVGLVVLMRYTGLGLQMRGAVESRRLIQLDGVNSGAVVATAWSVSGLMAALAGVLYATSPNNATLRAENYIVLTVAAIGAAAWAVLRSMPVAALVAVGIGVVTLVGRGYLTTSSIWFSAVLPSLPFIVLVCALVFRPGLRDLDTSKDPLSSVDPPPPPTTSRLRAPKLDRIIRVLWWILFAVFVISMLTWMPKTWETVFNYGLAFSTIFLSITLITGMGGQLSLAQAALSGVGAFTAGLLAIHFGLNFLVGGLIGAVLAAGVAVLLALVSLRLRGLGLALMTFAAALFFDKAVFIQKSVSGGTHGFEAKDSWFNPFNFSNPDGHAVFLLSIIVLIVCTIGVLRVRSGTVGQYLSAMRGSETAAAGIGINLAWQRVLVFAMSGGIAGLGGALLALQQYKVNPHQFTYTWSLAFVVIVITTGVTTVEGAIQGGIGFQVTQQLLGYLHSPRLTGLTFVLFAFGALTYAEHPEGILEYQKRTWTLRMERLIFRDSLEPQDSPLPALAGDAPSVGGGG